MVVRSIQLIYIQASVAATRKMAGFSNCLTHFLLWASEWPALAARDQASGCQEQHAIGNVLDGP